MAFLTTRVSKPDEDDYKKLGRCIKYLRSSRDVPLTLEADSNGGIKVRWWVDASFATHPDMRSHSGATMSLGHGSVYSSSTRQKLNTKSSTEAEVVGVDDALPMVLWTRHFLLEQGYNVSDNVIYQDNQGAMILERNGRSSSGRRTRHIDVRYFFVSDKIKQGEMRVENCATEDMVADFFTKPLQGSQFRKLRAVIMNLTENRSSGQSSTSQECVGIQGSTDDVQTDNAVSSDRGTFSKEVNNEIMRQAHYCL